MYFLWYDPHPVGGAIRLSHPVLIKNLKHYWCLLFQATSKVKEEIERFRLGVHKCKRIIYDCVPNNPDIFKCENINTLFKYIKHLTGETELTEIEQKEG